jgi:hypothetical protein
MDSRSADLANNSGGWISLHGICIIRNRHAPHYPFGSRTIRIDVNIVETFVFICLFISDNVKIAERIFTEWFSHGLSSPSVQPGVPPQPAIAI